MIIIRDFYTGKKLLSRKTFSHATLRKYEIRSADFTGVDLNGTAIFGSSFQDGRFHGAKLRRACISHSNFEYADFRGADLTGALLSNVVLRGAMFDNADLTALRLDRVEFIATGLIDGGYETRQYRFWAWKHPLGHTVFRAGCHEWNNFDDAIRYFTTNYGGSGNVRECCKRLEVLRECALDRGWTVIENLAKRRNASAITTTTRKRRLK